MPFHLWHSEHGLFCALYTDRGSHYFETPKAGGKVSKTVLTQVGRALQQLGIEHIAAYSPEARGRSERLFRTLQDRLPKELRLAGITTIDAANAWLKEHYKAEHNRQFAIAPEADGTAFVPDGEGAWRDILCVIEDRVVGNDNTVAWNGRRLQLPESRLRPHFVRAKVKVREYSRWGARHRSGTAPAGAVRRRRECSSGSNEGGIVLEGVKGWPVEDGARGKVIAAATLDPFCARCRRAAMPESRKGHAERPCP